MPGSHGTGAAGPCITGAHLAGSQAGLPPQLGWRARALKEAAQAAPQSVKGSPQAGCACKARLASNGTPPQRVRKCVCTARRAALQVLSWALGLMMARLGPAAACPRGVRRRARGIILCGAGPPSCRRAQVLVRVRVRVRRPSGRGHGLCHAASAHRSALLLQGLGPQAQRAGLRAALTRPPAHPLSLPLPLSRPQRSCPSPGATARVS